MIKINTSGDYVQLIYVDPVQESVQQELKSDTDAFECSYDSEGKLYLQFGLMRFENPDPTDFIVNDVAVTDAADFISKLNALFTGGGGGGSIPNPLTGDVDIDQAGHDLEFETSGGEFAVFTNLVSNLYIRQTGGDAELKGFNPTGGVNKARVFFNTTPTDASAYFDTDFNDGAHTSGIVSHADATHSDITYTADTHTFNGVIDYNGNAKLLADRTVDLNGEELTFASGQTQIYIQPTLNAEQIFIQAHNATADENFAAIYPQTTDTSASISIDVDYQDGAKHATISMIATAANSDLHYTADHHNFNLIEFADNAAAITGGLNAGDLYHTAGAVKIVI